MVQYTWNGKQIRKYCVRTAESHIRSIHIYMCVAAGAAAYERMRACVCKSILPVGWKMHVFYVTVENHKPSGMLLLIYYLDIFVVKIQIMAGVVLLFGVMNVNDWIYARMGLQMIWVK